MSFPIDRSKYIEICLHLGLKRFKTNIDKVHKKMLDILVKTLRYT